MCCGCVRAGLEDIKAMPYVRQTLAESLRMYPQPPLLIRRALAPDTLPPGLNGAPEGYPIGAGNHTINLSNLYYIHRHYTLALLCCLHTLYTMTECNLQPAAVYPPLTVTAAVLLRVFVLSGADLFISVWNLHHSPYLWKDPDTFRPERFEEVNTNPDFGDKWAGE